MAKKNETQFEQESAAAATPNTALALFATGDAAAAVDLSKFKRRNMPQMVKPGDVPIGGVITAEIMDIVDSPVSTVKGKLLWLKTASGQEFTFPCTGVIRNALAPGKDGAELEKTLKTFIGKTLVAKRNQDKTSQKYKKSMFMFDVFTN